MGRREEISIDLLNISKDEIRLETLKGNFSFSMSTGE